MRASRLFVAILVLVAIVVLPVHLALAQAPPPDPTRSLPDKVERGATFDVIVNFTCPADDFNGINLRDTAPAGWNVTPINPTWSDPDADGAEVEGDNQARLVWIGPYFLPDDENFTAKYKVTVPCSASPGNYSFSVNYPDENMLRWKTGDLSTINSTIIDGDYVLEVIGPTINFAPTSIDFYGAVNGTNPQDQTLELWSSTKCMLSWNVTDDANYTWNYTWRDWLSENGENITSGNCNYTEHSFVTLSVNSSGIPEGEYFANITINATGANNNLTTVPVTLHMSVTSILEAHVSFVGRGEAPDDRWIEPFEVWRFSPGTTQVVWEGNRTTNNTGWFNITDVPGGTYDIGIKNCTCLSELATNVTVGEGVGAVVDFGTIREGDCDENDVINMMDRDLLYMGFGTTNVTQGGHYCDLDRNGVLNMMDRDLMYIYWGETGDLF